MDWATYSSRIIILNLISILALSKFIGLIISYVKLDLLQFIYSDISRNTGAHVKRLRKRKTVLSKGDRGAWSISIKIKLFQS